MLFLLIIMAALLFIWVIICAIYIFKQIKKSYDNTFIKAKVRCSNCNHEMEVDLKDLTNSFFVKQKSITKTKLKGGMLINQPKYLSYQKKLYCPNCNEKHFFEVLNINEITKQTTPQTIKIALKGLVAMFIGGIVILIITSIPLNIMNQNRKEEIKQLKQQQYEEFRQNYDI